MFIMFILILTNIIAGCPLVENISFSFKIRCRICCPPFNFSHLSKENTEENVIWPY